MPDKPTNQKLKKSSIAYQRRHVYTRLLILLCLLALSTAFLFSYYFFNAVFQPSAASSSSAPPKTHLSLEYALSSSDVTPSAPSHNTPFAVTEIPWPSSVLLTPDLAPTLPTQDMFTPEARVTTYTVQPGDTLTHISQRFGLRETTLATANQLIGSHIIQIGQVLEIPPADINSISISINPNLDHSWFPLDGLDGYENVADLPSYALNYRVLGFSTLGWSIESYQIGTGPIRVAFVGGIHGGYEWNTILLAYEIIDHLLEHPELIPSSISLYIVPSANPDGQAAVIGRAGRFFPYEVSAETAHGRFNGNGVDLNRNWDCEWSATGYWRQQPVSAGHAPFSEIETRILKEFLTNPKMDAVVFWHSAMPGVFPGGCEQSFPDASSLGLVYAHAAPYPFFDHFTSYQVTGDASDWLSLQDIPAISVELHNHTDIDWEKNISGVLAVLNFLDAKPR